MPILASDLFRSSARYYKPFVRKSWLASGRSSEMQRGAVMLGAVLAALVLASAVHGASFTYDFSKGLGGWTHSSAVSDTGARACNTHHFLKCKPSGFFIRTMKHKMLNTQHLSGVCTPAGEVQRQI